MNKVLAIYGAGGLGREILELAYAINKKSKRWEEIVFIDDQLSNQTINGIKVYSYQEIVTIFPAKIEATIGVGEPAVREKLFKKLEKDNIPIATLIHPNTYIPESTKIGYGVTIQDCCFISCNVTIEDFVFIQPNVNVGHDDLLKKGCIVSGLVNLSGHVTIGQNTYIGISTAIKQGITIGDYCIVGMCSGVYHDIPDEMIAIGNPARPIKKNEEHIVFK